MNRKLPRFILILLMVTLVVALLACSPTGETPPQGDVPSADNTVGDHNPPTSGTTINKAQIFNEIKEGLVNTGEKIGESTTGIRYVDSKYVLVANSVNIGIEYQANYDLARDQDSEIMVRVFDYVKEENAMFVYYKDNDLYLQLGAEYIKMEDFGGTSTFKLFYESITALDMEHTLFSVEFADNIEAMAGSVETQNISKIILTDNDYNVTVKDINLDPLKTVVNNFILNNVASLGTRFDALTKKFMGFELSDLGKVQIGRFNAKLLTVFEKQTNGEDCITDFNMNFAGNQANNIDTYYFDASYATSYQSGEIRLTKFDNPENNFYESKSVSAMHFVGNLYVPQFDQTFDAEVKGNFSTNDNDINELFIDIVNRTENQGESYSIEERVIGAMYKDGMVYLDVKGLMEGYLGDFMEYEKLGLPRIKIDGLNMAEELKVLLEEVMALVQVDFDIGGLFGTSQEGEPSIKDNEEITFYLSKIRSEDGIFYITIDSELISHIIGESDATIISVIANSLGLEEGLIRDIIALGYFDDLALEVAWDTLNDDFIITLKAGDSDIFVLTLQSVSVPQQGLDIAFPDREEVGYFDTFQEFENPETISVHIEGTLHTQGRDNNDISKLMGIFIGDISGVNTPYAIDVSDTLYLSMDLWQTGDIFYVNALVKINDNLIVEICSNVNNPEELLVNNYELGVKYKMPRAEVVTLITELTNNAQAWDFDNIVQAIELISREAMISVGEHLDSNGDGNCDKCGVVLPASDFISMIISPTYDLKTGEKKSDPLGEILGIEDFMAELRVNFDFEAPTILVDASEYKEPVVSLIEEERWTSRYEAKWVETATIVFGTTPIEFKLTFNPDSVNFVEGVYEYYPEAKMFGKVIRYRMFITDLVNGMKKVKELYSQDTTYLMTIDPSLENPIPSTLEVVYEDGTKGNLAYQFVDFPYTNANIANLMGGLKRTAHKIVLGKGSITEQEFNIDIVVKGRNFVVGEGDYYNNIPIVARVKIDPYQYSMEKSEADARGEKYYPFKYRTENDGSLLPTNVLVLSFYEYTGANSIVNEYIEDFDWGFDESWINYTGGAYTIVQKFNTLDIALEVIVQAKIVDHIQINSENAGQYTIDSLVTSTYTIPSVSILKENSEKVEYETEVRIYFKTGHYRIVGNEPAGFDWSSQEGLFDGFYGESLDWTIKEANNVTIDRSVHPLDNGRTKFTECVFGDDRVGKQGVTLEVLCPTRVIGTRAQSTVAITSLSYLESGAINEVATVIEAVKVSLASFDGAGDVENDYYDFNPYGQSSDEDEDIIKKLPSSIFVKVVYQGREQVIEYPIKWIGENNIIDDEGNVLNSFAEETFLQVRGVIGDGELTQTLQMIIHNHSVSYSDVTLYVEALNEDTQELEEQELEVVKKLGGIYVEGLNPYEEFVLPVSAKLHFPAVTQMESKKFENLSWYVLGDNGNPVVDENGNRVNAQGYLPHSNGGVVTVCADVVDGADQQGVLKQTITLNLSYKNMTIDENRIYGLSSIDSFELVEFETIHYLVIDTYDVLSEELYNDLIQEGGIKKIDIAFDDGSRTYGNSIEISWINLDEFLTVLQSPLGSSTYYNMGKYEKNIIFLRGIIREGTVQEKEIRMGFEIIPRVLGDINFSNYDRNLSVKDENNLSQVTINTEIQKVRGETQEIEGVTTPVLGENGYQIITISGHNSINITINKYFALTNDEGLCSPSEYVKYLLSDVSLSFSDTVRYNELYLDLPANFDDLVYGNATTTDPNVTITSTHVIFRLEIEKLTGLYNKEERTGGSCAQPFALTITFLKDNTIVEGEDVYNESVEIFNEYGERLYENNDGYLLSNEFVVEYAHSGAITYNNLVWYADETISSFVNSERIDQGAEVKNVKYDFFNFTSTRIVKLYTYLPNGQKFRRHISFYAKYVGFTKYGAESIKLTEEDDYTYQIVNGTIEIENVYDFLPVENIVTRLPKTILPYQTSAFISSYDITFTLDGEWKPAQAFVDDNDETAFSVEKLRDAITSAGLNPTLLATNTITGYNGEKQEIRIYVSVKALSAGQISHEDYAISGNSLTYDQYANEGNGRFVLPKDIKVTFGDVFYQFTTSDDVKYEIRSKDDNSVFTTISEITYNNKGNTLSSEYGYEANDAIYLRVTLPDGNSGLRLIVTFPNRVLKKVYYDSKVSEGQSVSVEGIYYIDPYDRDTFKLPTTADFEYDGSSELVTQSVTWTANDESIPFTQNADGEFIYNGGGHAGGYYLFHSSLQSFDSVDSEQFFIMQVVVLDRTLTRPSTYPTAYKTENPFAMRVEDLPSTLTAQDFKDLGVARVLEEEEEEKKLDALKDLLEEKGTVSLADTKSATSLYDATFVEKYNPQVPDVLWKIEKDGEKVPLVDDDILVKGGFKYNIYGCVGSGSGEERTFGEELVMEFSADTWTFKEVDGLVDNVIEFNDFTLDSIEKEFVVTFIVESEGSAPTEKQITFYPENYVQTDVERRTLMKWNKKDWADTSERGSITLQNQYKTLGENTITTFNVYLFDAQQVGIDELDFGFGQGYAYSGEVEIVIDPLNPVIPTTAYARGRLNLDAQTLIELGEVEVDWEIDDPSNEESIYNMNMPGGVKTVYCSVTSGGEGDTVFKFAVNVTYLNRTPQTITTVESGYTNVARDGNYYPLMTNYIIDGKENRIFTFVVDPTPTDDRLFSLDGATNVQYVVPAGGYERSNYTLPSTLRLTFANEYDSDSIATEGLQKLGSEINLIDVEWIISRDISLVGTDVEGGNIVAKIRRFRVQYVANGETYVSELYDYVDNDSRLGNYLTLALNTINRQVEYTYVMKNGEEAVLSEVPEGSIENYQQARDEFYIDPYNIAFPEEVFVIFTGSTIPYHATSVEWEYNRDQLGEHGVITGSIGAQYMLIMAEMSVYGTTLQVQFPIRARNIPVSKELEDGQTTMDPLSAGTLYVLAGVPLEEQLPTRLYYRFDYEDGTSEIASVPLSFPAKSLSTVQTDVVGRVYSHVEAKLGYVDDDNVFFTIKVIDPKLYALRSTVQNSPIGDQLEAQAYVNGGFIYDHIAIGINAAGAYVPGPETSVLPDRIIVSEDGEFMEIVNIEYDIENLTATLECRYTFLSFSDSPRLSGDKDATSENSDKMFLRFSVPIKTYAYNWLEEETATFEKTQYEFELGTIVTASDMPLTTSGIAPIWDLGNLNQNRAGEYVATCHYKNAYGKIITGEITIVIKRRAITADDFTWVEDADGINFRNRVYDGRTLNVKDYIELGEFLREDGSYGPLNYTVQYSIDGRKNWQTEQPVQVKEFADSPDYYVRIIVMDEDDYNYTGSVAYRMVIEKLVINEEDIYFYDQVDASGNHIKIENSTYEYIDKNGSNASMQIKQVFYEYTGEERTPAIGGVPQGARTTSVYAEFDPNASQQTYIPNLKPNQVGTYIMRTVVDDNQRNHIIGDVEFIILIHVTKKQVQYSLDSTFEYTGEYFDIPVNGLPATLSNDMSVTYTYKNIATGQAVNRVKDAGTYLVTVMIEGGRNYPDANLDENNVYTALHEQHITINKRRVEIHVNTVTSEYLEPLKPLGSALTIVSSSNPNEAGLIGRFDTSPEVAFGRGSLEVSWVGGTLTYKHMVGSYKLDLVNRAQILDEDFCTNYLVEEIHVGSYEIVAEKANTVVVSNVSELSALVEQLRDGDTAIWYFKAGNYGNLTINVNASVSIIGSYDLSSEKEIEAVSFDSIVINKGAVLLDIIAFKDIAYNSSVLVGKNASSLTVSRCKFTRSGSTILTNSSAIGTESGYAGTLYVSDSYFMGYTTAIYMLSGSLELSNSELYQNTNGVYVQKGNIVLDTNKFIGNRGYAVNIAYSSATTSIFDNLFDSNDVAIKTSVALRNDIRVQNTFVDNTVTFEGWSEEW